MAAGSHDNDTKPTTSSFRRLNSANSSGYVLATFRKWVRTEYSNINRVGPVERFLQRKFHFILHEKTK